MVAKSGNGGGVELSRGSNPCVQYCPAFEFNFCQSLALVRIANSTACDFATLHFVIKKHYIYTMHPKLREVAITAVAEYMGVAAEFVVDDALQDVQSNASFSGKPDLQQMYFFVALGKQLPPTVPYAKVKEAITKALP